MPEIDETTSAILRFDDGRLASFRDQLQRRRRQLVRSARHQGTAEGGASVRVRRGACVQLTIDGRTTRQQVRQTRSVRGRAASTSRHACSKGPSPSRPVKRDCRTCALSPRFTSRPRLAELWNYRPTNPCGSPESTRRFAARRSRSRKRSTRKRRIPEKSMQRRPSSELGRLLAHRLQSLRPGRLEAVAEVAR